MKTRQKIVPTISIEIDGMRRNGKRESTTVEALFDESTMDAIVEQGVAESICDLTDLDPYAVPIAGRKVMAVKTCLIDVNFNGCSLPEMAFVVPDGTITGASAIIGTEGLERRGIIIDVTRKQIIADNCDERLWIESATCD